MTRLLARLADIAYRRRGRMVIGWIVAMVVIIALGYSLKGEYDGRLQHPGLGVEGRERLTRAATSAATRAQEVYVVWKAPQGADSPRRSRRIDAFLAEAQKVKDIGRPGPDRGLRGRDDRDRRRCR